MPENLKKTFEAKVDAFAASLSAEEQTMLLRLLTSGDDDEVAGFIAGSGWPGMGSLDVWKAPAGTELASNSDGGGFTRPLQQNQRIDLQLWG